VARIIAEEFESLSSKFQGFLVLFLCQQQLLEEFKTTKKIKKQCLKLEYLRIICSHAAPAAAVKKILLKE